MPSVAITDTVSIDHEINKKKKLKKRKYFSTSRNAPIINAVNGFSYDIIQGTREELRLFKVIDSTSYYDEKGYLKSNKQIPNKNGNYLYFDSPDQFYKHMNLPVNFNTVKKWNEKIRLLETE